jgi:hypothetical protein
MVRSWMKLKTSSMSDDTLSTKSEIVPIGAMGYKQGVTDSVPADPAAQIGTQIIGQTLDRASGEIRFGVKQGKRPFPRQIHRPKIARAIGWQ